MTTYVYGIASSSHPALPDGMEGIGRPACPVRILKNGDLAAIVSDAPEDLKPKRRDLLAHQNVLSEAGAAGSVLPMRFGSLAPDDETVVSVLGERAGHYEERLRTLDGKVEYNVKATHHEEAVLHQVLAENPELRAMVEANQRAGGGTHEQKLQLGEAITNGVRAREQSDAVEVRRALEPAAEAVGDGPEGTGWLANISFLVDRKTAEGFLSAVEELRATQPHLDLRVHGPLPPYSFVDPGPSEPAE
ncbi:MULTISPECIES: GvpL/GvpF family gas vesicle protein [Streptomyces]|uniref:Gas vesicle protein n=1 Tax=Streptomyces venezuelae TaxID=54571 RepID=A0A5P2BK96_STRVZ|nr:GvpL/GvpF family gas vesicle protein [Streptomyces venezuelae]MYY86490.1 gas vesicle protein [Streptomyces sp. SID335]MYZ19616.1 gas vesicle protein [Streptomyces sp. SID337]NDZ87647.1 GvpL/GvpF family gas vesicle protein [Streptomyces sp. SID10115]NEA02289.1 GvpL/GvpF family gas vesicle protein [Streptomyces sp. SID10116]NEB45416.1 GvpL/GvpF family gas vesicle protein [Streptomyces sp. SID339]